MKRVTIHTDGSCLNNGADDAPGGYGIVLEYNGHRKELSGYIPETTNNRAEMVAIIEALNALKEPCEVTVICDSRLIVNTMNYNWKTKANQDLWHKLRLATMIHKVTFVWVKGHNGNVNNERVNILAQTAAAKGALCESVASYGRKECNSDNSQ